MPDTSVMKELESFLYKPTLDFLKHSWILWFKFYTFLPVILTVENLVYIDVVFVVPAVLSIDEGSFIVETEKSYKTNGQSFSVRPAGKWPRTCPDATPG